MTLIIPRGWVRNRRPAPFDRRTPLILPGVGGGSKIENIGKPWILGPNQSDVIVIPVNKAFWEAPEYLGQPTLAKRRNYLAMPSRPEETGVDLNGTYAGPVALSNSARVSIGSGRYNWQPLYRYDEIWPSMMTVDKFGFNEFWVENDAYYRIVYGGEHSEDAIYFMSDYYNKTERTDIYNRRIYYNGRMSVIVMNLLNGSVNYNGTRTEYIPPEEYREESAWYHFAYRFTSSAPYSLMPISASNISDGRTAKFCPFVLAERKSGPADDGSYIITVKHVERKTYDLTQDWIKSLPVGERIRV